MFEWGCRWIWWEYFVNKTCDTMEINMVRIGVSILK